MSYNIGIIGMGFVGTAVKEGLIDHYHIWTSDLDQSKNQFCGHRNHHACGDNLTVCKNSDIIFICVNTPQGTYGKCDTSLVEDVIRGIDEQPTETNKIIVIKSTVPPGTTERINKSLTNSKLSVIFNPEFLTQANHIQDFKNQDRIVLGGPESSVNLVAHMYQRIFPTYNMCVESIFNKTNATTYLCTDSTTAEMVKYTANSFFATKVSFFNEMKQICDKLGIDYDEMISYVMYDKRIGQSHYQVPGPDGKYG